MLKIIQKKLCRGVRVEDFVDYVAVVNRSRTTVFCGGVKSVSRFTGYPLLSGASLEIDVARSNGVLNLYVVKE